MPTRATGRSSPKPSTVEKRRRVIDVDTYVLALALKELLDSKLDELQHEDRPELIYVVGQTVIVLHRDVDEDRQNRVNAWASKHLDTFLEK